MHSTVGLCPLLLTTAVLRSTDPDSVSTKLQAVEPPCRVQEAVAYQLDCCYAFDCKVYGFEKAGKLSRRRKLAMEASFHQAALQRFVSMFDPLVQVV